MPLFNLIFEKFSPKERKVFFIVLAVLVLSLIGLALVVIDERGVSLSIPGGSYTEGIVGEPVDLNPVLSSGSVDQEMSSLLYLPLSGLLETWSVSPDGKIYTLELKDGLKWSDGKDLTSDDVVFTINTAEDYRVDSPFYQSWQGVSAERISALQVKLTIPNQNVFFIDNIENLPVIPEHIYGAIPVENFWLSSYKLQPVVDGPYEVKGFSKRKDGFITDYHLTSNPYFPGKSPLIPDFSFKFFENVNDLAKAMELHEINGYDSLPPIGFDPSILKGFTTEEMPASDYYAIFFNQNSNPALKDANVRKALVESVDKNSLIQQILGGNASEITGPVLISHAAGTSTAPSAGTSTFNPSDASQLLSSYKSKNKISEINITLSVPNVDFLKRATDFIKNEWENAGITNVDVETVNVNDPVSSPIKTRDYQALLFGNFLKDEEDLFPFWHSSQSSYPGLNLSLYNSQAADKLMEQIRETSDESERGTMLRDLNLIITNDNPALFLFSLPYFYIHSDELRGFKPTLITTPGNIFQNVNQWSIAEVKVIK